MALAFLIRHRIVLVRFCWSILALGFASSSANPTIRHMASETPSLAHSPSDLPSDSPSDVPSRTPSDTSSDTPSMIPSFSVSPSPSRRPISSLSATKSTKRPKGKTMEVKSADPNRIVNGITTTSANKLSGRAAPSKGTLTPPKAAVATNAKPSRNPPGLSMVEGVAQVNVSHYELAYAGLSSVPNPSDLILLQNSTQAFFDDGFRELYSRSASAASKATSFVTYAPYLSSQTHFVGSSPTDDGTGIVRIQWTTSANFVGTQSARKVPTAAQLSEYMEKFFLIAADKYVREVKSISGLQTTAQVKWTSPSAQTMPSALPSIEGTVHALAPVPAKVIGVQAVPSYIAYEIPFLTRTPNLSQLQSLLNATHNYFDKVFRGVYEGGTYHRFQYSNLTLGQTILWKTDTSTRRPSLLVNFHTNVYVQQAGRGILPSSLQIALEMRSAVSISDLYLTTIQSVDGFRRTLGVEFVIGDINKAPVVTPHPHTAPLQQLPPSQPLSTPLAAPAQAPHPSVPLQQSPPTKPLPKPVVSPTPPKIPPSRPASSNPTMAPSRSRGLTSVKASGAFFSYRVPLQIEAPSAVEINNLLEVTQLYLDSLFRGIYSGSSYSEYSQCMYSLVYTKQSIFRRILRGPFNVFVSFDVSVFFKWQAKRKLPSPDMIAQDISNAVSLSGTYLSFVQSVGGFRSTMAVAVDSSYFAGLSAPTLNPSNSPTSPSTANPSLSPGVVRVAAQSFYLAYRIPFLLRAPALNDLESLRNQTQAFFDQLFQAIYPTFLYSDVLVKTSLFSTLSWVQNNFFVSYRTDAVFGKKIGQELPSSIQIAQDISTAIYLSSAYLKLVQSIPGFHLTNEVTFVFGNIAYGGVPSPSPVPIDNTSAIPQQRPTWAPWQHPSSSPSVSYKPSLAVAPPSSFSHTPTVAPTRGLGDVVVNASDVLFSYQIPLLTQTPSLNEIVDLRQVTQKYLDNLFHSIYTGDTYFRFRYSQVILVNRDIGGVLGLNFNFFVGFDLILYFKKQQRGILPSTEKVFSDLSAALGLSGTYLALVQSVSGFQRTTRVALSVGDSSQQSLEALSRPSATDFPAQVEAIGSSAGPSAESVDILPHGASSITRPSHPPTPAQTR